MTGEIIYAPPSVTFDASHLIELERWVRADVPRDVSPLLSPFDGYTRTLTERGGFRVTYIDQVSNLFLDALRVFAWTIATALAGYALFKSPLPGILSSVLFLAIACGNVWIVTRKWKVQHSIEIHPEGMIIDGKHVFSMTTSATIGPNFSWSRTIRTAWC